MRGRAIKVVVKTRQIKLVKTFYNLPYSSLVFNNV